MSVTSFTSLTSLSDTELRALQKEVESEQQRRRQLYCVSDNGDYLTVVPDPDDGFGIFIQNKFDTPNKVVGSVWLKQSAADTLVAMINDVAYRGNTASKNNEE